MCGANWERGLSLDSFVLPKKSTNKIKPKINLNKSKSFTSQKYRDPYFSSSIKTGLRYSVKQPSNTKHNASVDTDLIKKALVAVILLWSR